MITHNSIFETFNDGLCIIHEIDEDGNEGEVRERLRFQERTVGVKRFYEAMTNKVQIDRLVRIPDLPWVSSEYLAEIDGQIYEIKQVQSIPDTKPKAKDLSLHLIRQRRLADGAV